MASDAPRTDVPSANGRSAGASLAGTRFFCSWSGGKDAYLALQRAVERGGVPAALVCMLHEDGGVSRGHGLPLALLEEQAAALGVPLVTRAATWDGYEATFVSLLHELRAQGIAGRRVRRHRPAGAPRLGRGCLRGRRPRLPPAALAGAAPPAARRVPRRRLPRHHRRRRLLQAGRRVPRPRAGRRRHRPPRGRRRRRLRRGGRVPHHGHLRAALLASRPARVGRHRGARRPPPPARHAAGGGLAARRRRLAGRTVTELADIVRSRLVKDRRESPPS